ncbi:LLM class flavin-dependent oxidoreductase [Asanoa iriomotensis]|uniref:LLM class flavin-dependent oxidoreductase n=1 Tax=Asanoa iriomotensis TaxID=234613 RepID=UPI001942296E|nr:LLM class flavin-dependent oxidoreductase [Asanoa iriomotensis]
MRIGIGLPNAIPGVPGSVLVDWARRAEHHGFAGLATIDRMAYPNHDSLTALAAAAAVTSRIELFTDILGPTYPPALLAKVAATVDQISRARLTLGLAPGAGAGQGQEFDALLDEVHRIWSGNPEHSPAAGRAVPVLIAGAGEPALRRLVARGAGGALGGASPEQAIDYVARVRAAWREAGREGKPRIAVLAHYALGPGAELQSLAHLQDFYALLGEYADTIAANALRTPETIREAVKAFAAAGVTELYLNPTVPTVDQVDRLADVVSPALRD